MKDTTILLTKIKFDELWTNLKFFADKLKVIKHSNRTFYEKSLSTNRSKEVWETIRNIIKPQFKQFELNPDTINEYFNSIAVKLTNTDGSVIAMIIIKAIYLTSIIPPNRKFSNTWIRWEEICSTGGDNIPAKFKKPVAAQLYHQFWLML